MSKPVITVKNETLDYLQNTGIAQIMRDWCSWLNDNGYTNGLKERVFRDLNSAVYDSSASDVIAFYISEAYEFVPIEKTYQIVLPEVFHTDRGMSWNYLFMGLTDTHRPTIECTDSKVNICTFPESKLKHFPKWAQELAEEVEK